MYQKFQLSRGSGARPKGADGCDTSGDEMDEWDSLLRFGPCHIVNSDRFQMLGFNEVIDAEIGIKAIRNFMPILAGDVLATWAGASLLQRLTDYGPQTDFWEGIANLVARFREYYGK